MEFDENPFFTPYDILVRGLNLPIRILFEYYCVYKLNRQQDILKIFFICKNNKSNNGKTKICMDILFHTYAKICAEPSHTLWTFSSIPMFI